VDVLAQRKYFVLVDQGWSDLGSRGARRGLVARSDQGVHREHGGERRVLRVKCALRISRLARGVLASAAVMAGVGLTLGLPMVAAVGVAAGLGTGAGLLERRSGSGARSTKHFRTWHGARDCHYAPPLDVRDAVVQ